MLSNSFCWNYSDNFKHVWSPDLRKFDIRNVIEKWKSGTGLPSAKAFKQKANWLHGPPSQFQISCQVVTESDLRMVYI